MREKKKTVFVLGCYVKRNNSKEDGLFFEGATFEEKGVADIQRVLKRMVDRNGLPLWVEI